MRARSGPRPCAPRASVSWSRSFRRSPRSGTASGSRRSTRATSSISGGSRLFAPADEDTALLLGDYLYAHGLVRVAEAGKVEAVADLAALISICAQLRADELPGDGEAWAATASTLGEGPEARAHGPAAAPSRSSAPSRLTGAWSVKVAPRWRFSLTSSRWRPNGRRGGQEGDHGDARRRPDLRRRHRARPADSLAAPPKPVASGGLPMRELPTGTVTFLFTDIEGSTRLLEELG